MKRGDTLATVAVVLCALVANATCRAASAGVSATTVDAPSLSGSRAGAATSMFGENGMTRTVRHMYALCADSEDIFWCVKVQAAKLLGRALKVPNIKLLEGVAIVRKAAENGTRAGRASAPTAEVITTNRDLEQLSMKSLDALLMERLLSFTRSRQLQVNLPRLLAHGQSNGRTLVQSALDYGSRWMGSVSADGGGVVDAVWPVLLQQQTVEAEGRKKKDDKKYLGPFIAAVMLKAAILKMAYHSIAILAGKALIVGKIALIISAIIGLKKLMSQEGGEKTTYEIVKHPQVQQSHTYSSSHSGEYEAGGHEGSSGGSYHRSIDDEMLMQDKAYQAWVPSKAA